MNKTVNNVLIFGAGSIVGALVAFKFADEKYKKIAQDEIREVTEYYRKKNTHEQTYIPESSMEPEEEDEGPTLAEYEEFLKNQTNYIGGLDISEKGESVATNRPYVITPEDFDENDYDTASLSYYEEDGILVDEDGEVVEDVESMVGCDPSIHFGEYEDDSVFVRDDRLGIDYEILLKKGRFSALGECEVNDVDE